MNAALEQKLLSEMTRAVVLEKVEDEDECDETGSFRLVRAWLTAGAASFELRWSQERDLYGLVRGGWLLPRGGELSPSVGTLCVVDTWLHEFDFGLLWWGRRGPRQHPGALDLWAHDHTRGGVPVPVIQSDAPQSCVLLPCACA